MIDVVFRRLRDSAHPVDVVFGEPAVPVVDAAGALDIALPSFTPSFEGLLDYDLAVSGSDVIGTAASWQPAASVIAPTLHARHATGQRTSIARRAPWGRGRRVVGDLRSAWQQLDSIITHLRPGWQSGELLRFAAGSGWQHGTPTPLAARSPWQAGIPTRTGAAGGWSVADILPARPRGLPWGTALPTPVRVQASAQSGASVWQRPMRIRWTGTEPLPTGRSVIILPPVEPPWRCYTPPLGGAVHLLFDERRAPGFDILFSCGVSPGLAATVIVPIREVYLTINAATLTRLDTGAVIPTLSMSMSLDTDSWTWSFSASVPGRALPDLTSANGDPVLVQATVNGAPYNFIIDSRTRKRTFASSYIQVQGVGLAAELEDPYAPTMTFGNAGARTGRQLLDDILTFNGVPIDWSIDRAEFEDWIVPSGVFSHVGTYMSALNEVAGAIGAYVQPHDTARKLHVLLRYPTPVWEWAGVTPDLELPAAVVSDEGIEWRHKAPYNRVFVYGQEGGVNCQYTRAGTAGDRVAPDVMHPLITAPAAGRQRGRAIISDTGAIATVTLRLPVLAETGVIKPGKFVRYVDEGVARVGLTRSVAVDVSMPTIYQTIRVETHVEPV